MKIVLRLALVAVVAASAVLICYAVRGRLPDNCAGTDTQQCRYDLDALRKTDTNLLIAAGVRYIRPAVTGVTALAVAADDTVLVGSRTGIELLSPDGRSLAHFDTGARVHCLAVTDSGDILAGFGDHIEVFGRDGARKAVWRSPAPGATLTSVAACTGLVFAADCANRVIWRFNLGGELLGRIGDSDDAERKNGFIVPSAFFDVAAGRDGTVWVVNPGAHRLENFTADGRFLSYWGRASMAADGFCGCCNPSHFAINVDGSFVTSEKHIVRVKIYDPAGRLKGIISGQEQWDKEAVGLDLAVDSAGRILVLDPQADVVRVYSMEQADTPAEDAVGRVNAPGYGHKRQ
ncbi:MAG: hypothetical protein WCL44_11445 [bacterium]